MTPINLDTARPTEATDAASDRFSWKRVAEVARYFSTVTNRQLLVYAIISAIFAVLLLLPLDGVAQAGIFTLEFSVLPIMFQLAPIAFAKSGDTRVVDRMLPAKASEKFTFYILYLLVAVPIAVYVLPEGAMWLYGKIPAIHTDAMMGVKNMHFGNPPIVICMNILAAVAGSMTCLFVTLYARHSRIIKAVISTFAVQFTVGILGAVYGMYAVFQAGFNDGLDGKMMSPEQQQDFAHKIISDFSQATPYMVSIISLLAVYTGLMLWLTYRTLRKRNL